jgi:hypothetical protein
MKNENKQIKASSWALGILFVLSAVVLGMFFGIGYDNKTYFEGADKSLVDPIYTGLLIIWLYTLVGLCILSVLVFGIAAAIRNLKTRTSGQQRTGFAGWVFLFTFIAIGVSYFMADTTKLLLGDDKTWATDVFDLTLSDVCLYSIYTLFAVALLCVILAMTGIFKARR